MLLDARRAYDDARDVPEEMRKLAYEELLIAEGSDWCWWYGPEHGSDNRPEFDQLYRDHLSNVYRALGQKPPAALARPILKSQEGELHERPSNPIHATLDGEVTSYFEWLGAGHYRPDLRSGAMHGSEQPLVREIYYGADDAHVYVRVEDGGGDFGIEFENGPVQAEVVKGRIVEIRAPRIGDRFRITTQRNGLPAVKVPANSWLEL
jgi:hypothetical protein